MVVEKQRDYRESEEKLHVVWVYLNGVHFTLQHCVKQALFIHTHRSHVPTSLTFCHFLLPKPSGIVCYINVIHLV